MQKKFVAASSMDQIRPEPTRRVVVTGEPALQTWPLRIKGNDLLTGADN